MHILCFRTTLWRGSRLSPCYSRRYHGYQATIGLLLASEGCAKTTHPNPRTRRRRCRCPSKLGNNVNSLQLQGRIQCSGFETDYRRILIRLAVANDPPTHPADTALVRSPRDCDAAAAAGYMSALFVNSKPEPRRTITNIAWLEGQFDWLSPGDVIAIDTSAGRYRVLWRATAKHNAFLVTDRCDHYCLMCSHTKSLRP